MQLFRDVQRCHCFHIDESLCHDNIRVLPYLLLDFVEFGLEVALVEGAEEDEGQEAQAEQRDLPVEDETDDVARRNTSHYDDHDEEQHAG